MVTLRIVLPRTVFSTQGKIKKKGRRRFSRRARESGPKITPGTFPAGYSVGERKADAGDAWFLGERWAEHGDVRPVPCGRMWGGREATNRPA